ncbi:MAG TPA: prephenate dehydrogenase/arogenate dehydrogenase family protein, partial [Methanocella sp.]|nr:prephenate dehydrogenase/arogenate dehydrogenase family protein [Methanocella sp.]
MPHKALVVGGAGAMGRWCAGFLKRAGFEVAISSRGDVSAAAASLGVGQAPAGDAGQFDVVVLAVPIDAVEEAAALVAPRMRPGSLLMDLSSLKKGPMAAMLAHAPPGVGVIGVHPLFGPEAESLEGRSVVLVPSGRTAGWLPVLRAAFEDAGAGVVVATAEEHDAKMAVVQGLTHFMYVAWGLALERLDVSLNDLNACQTPVYGITKELAGRVLAQSPELYALIQSGEDVAPVRAAFVAACRDLAKMADCGDLAGFERAFRSAAEHYGDTAGARARSERLLRLARDFAFVREASGAERAFALRDGRRVYGVVKEARRDDFTLETPSETIDVRYDEATPLGPGWLRRLKGGYPVIGRDIMVKLPIGADARVLQWVLTKIDGVTGVEVATQSALDPAYIVSRFTVDVSPERSEET